MGNIEGLYDAVSAITGIDDWERIPDEIFDQADQVELIDIEPPELLERLEKSGETVRLFTVEQLTALREAALRRCADPHEASFPAAAEGGYFSCRRAYTCLSFFSPLKCKDYTHGGAYGIGL